MGESHDQERSAIDRITKRHQKFNYEFLEKLRLDEILRRESKSHQNTGRIEKSGSFEEDKNLESLSTEGSCHKESV